MTKPSRADDTTANTRLLWRIVARAKNRYVAVKNSPMRIPIIIVRCLCTYKLNGRFKNHRVVSPQSILKAIATVVFLLFVWENVHSLGSLVACKITPYNDEAMTAIPAVWRMLGPQFLRHG